MANDAECNLIFDLLALQDRLIDQAQLVTAFQAWSCDKAGPLADHAAVDAMVARHVARRGDNLAKSLATVQVAPSARAGLQALGERQLDASLAYCMTHALAAGAARTVTYTASQAL
jgi:hypothetical protein